MLSSLRVVVPPAQMAVSVVQAKAYCRIDHDSDDELIADTILVATEMVEKFLGRSLITQTLAWTFSDTLGPWAGQVLPIQPIVLPIQPIVLPIGFTSYVRRPVELPRSPVQSIVSVAVSKADGTATTLAATSDFDQDLATEPALLTLRQGWVQSLSPGGHLSVRFVAGYGDDPKAVPATIRLAVKWLVAFLYENRGDAGGEMPSFVKDLLWLDRLVTFGG